MAFHQAGGVIDKLNRRSGSIRSLCFAPQIKDKKSVYALVCQTLRYATVLDQIIKAHPLILRKFPRREGLCRVLLYDYVINKLNREWKSNKRLGSDVTELLPFRTLLISFLQGLIHKKRLEDPDLPEKPEILLPEILQQTVELPRYVRVNTLKVTVQEAIQHFEVAGFKHGDTPPPHVETLAGKKIFWDDADLPHLLVFPQGTDLHADEWVEEGKLILQDKASCLSAVVLLEDCEPARGLEDSTPQRFCDVIDACAAPGNKTTHAAALMARSQHPHQLSAVDKDDKRVLLLQKFTDRAGAPVRVLHQSFLDLDPTNLDETGKITHLMVDPSCSGSGIVSRLDSLLSMSEITAQRKEKLATFQKTIVCHAMSFPNAQRVVYSTCSLFEEENEQVVEYVLEQMGAEWELHKALPHWKHRGLRSYKVGDYCIRASPSEDQTNGFFVARFHRKSQTTPSTQQVNTTATPPAQAPQENEKSESAVPFYLRATKRSHTEASDSDASEEPPMKKVKMSKNQRKRAERAQKSNKQNVK